MIIGISKELARMDLDFYDIDLNKLQAHEVFGLFLSAQISERKLKEILRVDQQTLNQLIKRIYSDIEQTSLKDDTQVEIDFYI